MNKFKIFSIAFIVSASVSHAQDIDQAKKAIDGEQYENAKKILKSIINTKPNGKVAFLLGNIYLKQNIEDSAKVFFNRGLTLSDGAKFNNIGLAQLDLNAGNVAAAQAKFDIVTKDIKKKDTEEYVYIARAYMNADKPNYISAIDVLNKAKAVNPNDAQLLLALGDAYFGEKNQNDAYASYRNAFNIDSSLLRAKMQLGVLLKGAKAYTEAVKAYDEVIALNPNYGPVYRELAETYYLWGNNQPKNYDEYIKKALGFYEKYMSLTDYSLSSRMRHADFLILAKDYKDLEIEANKMKQLDKVNPRILRYLGYSAFENGNNDAALAALQEYVNKGGNKIIPYDYLYLGKAELKKSIGADGKTVDQALKTSGLSDVSKAVVMEPLMTSELNEMGKAYFGQKQYGIAASLFEIATSNPNSKTFLEDNVYYSICVITENRSKDAKDMDKVALGKADKAMDSVIAQKPDYQEAYFYKGRINTALENDEAMASNYQKYLDLLLPKGADEITKNKAKITEAYNHMASHYANSDKAKAKELLNKTLALDPTNTYALESLKLLK
jgi:tetratricopeptide (TPR) repeat protein